jgi:hypothetical protein
MQRRFQHVLMATRFYRALFTDGDTKLNLGKDATDLFKKSTGMPPTVSVIDSLANEAMREVREGTRSFANSLERKETYTATKLLQEAYLIGEYMPEVRLIPVDKKRQCLDFARNGYQLISAVDVRDYARAEELVKKMKAVSTDFDDTQPTAKIDAAKLQARMLLAKAKQAALANDKVTLEQSLTAAAEIWPGNPEFKEVSEKLFNQGDVLQQTLRDFDGLYRQKNFRQIYADRGRFIAAIAMSPERADQLKKVEDDLRKMEAAVLRGQEMARQNNFAGAWESMEKAREQFPDDTEILRGQADYARRATEFVHVIDEAVKREQADQVGASLAWYLKAQKLYPYSDFARDGISRLAPLLLPES